ncbi:MAG: zinc ribbon domain-containing protein [Spirochaetes bacterium]|nr:zinc ribbon domain-containing protein [Deltaproteobacteria bacterium]RKY01708.1 MAG: zinc ribbon domain-containing protein [Spirochaetota bacterium]
MPTYEYECIDCGYHFEVKQSISDNPINECPQCGGKVKRVISGGTGFIMKGGNSSFDGGLTRCGREQTCCGRETPCRTPPCKN